MNSKIKTNQNPSLQLATFAAGCFWGVEEIFAKLKGVKKTLVGYTGGTVENPTYQIVCNGKTGHAESVQITYNPEEITYEELLNVFWDNHNPTTPNRQGPDIGEQYRSIIFYHTLEQKLAAEKSLELLEKSGKFTRPIVTQILPVKKFYQAEEYHQKYFLKKRS